MYDPECLKLQVSKFLLSCQRLIIPSLNISFGLSLQQLIVELGMGCSWQEARYLLDHTFSMDHEVDFLWDSHESHTNFLHCRITWILKKTSIPFQAPHQIYIETLDCFPLQYSADPNFAAKRKTLGYILTKKQASINQFFYHYQFIID